MHWRLRNLGSLSVPVIKQQKESFKENSSIRSTYVIKSAGKKKVLPSNHWVLHPDQLLPDVFFVFCRIKAPVSPLQFLYINKNKTTYSSISERKHNTKKCPLCHFPFVEKSII